MDTNKLQKNAVESEIAAVKTKVDAVESEIAAVKTKLDVIDSILFKRSWPSDDSMYIFYSELDQQQLINSQTQLQQEKILLLQKEERLQTEKSQLMTSVSSQQDLSDNSITIKSNTSISASNLKNSDAFSHVALPFGPKCYYPYRQLISCIVERANGTQQSTTFREGFSTDSISLPFTYRKHKQGEEHFCRSTLGILMRQLINSIKSSKVRFAEGPEINRFVSFVFASTGSKCEPCIMYKKDGLELVLLSSEAKAVNNSLFEAFSQAVQIASDSAVHMYQMTNLDYSDVVVPFICCCSDQIQIGAVYLIADSYPCATLISPALSLLSQLGTVFCWLEGLADGLNLMIEKLDECTPSSTEERQQRVCQLQLNSTFVKPVGLLQLSEHKCELASRTYYLLHVLYILYERESLRETIVFPSGVIGFPSEDYQPDMRNKLLAVLKKLQKSIYTKADYLPGHPLLIFPELTSADGWKLAMTLAQESESIQSLFLEKLKQVLDDIYEAGVVATDVRRPNIFYRVSTVPTIGSDSAAAASSEGTVTTVEIKLIDIDEYFVANDYLPSWLVESMAGDSRYPNLNVAKEEFHVHFLEEIKRELQTGRFHQAQNEVSGFSTSTQSPQGRVGAKHQIAANTTSTSSRKKNRK